MEDIEVVLEGAILLISAYALFLSGGVNSSIDPANFDVSAFKDFFAVCRQEFVRGNAEEVARLDAEDFVFTDEFLLRDGIDLKRLGSIEELVKERQGSIRRDRYNEVRYNEVFTSVADSSTLKILAAEGATVPLALDFINNPIAEKPRNLQKRLGNCYAKHVFKLWQKGFALVLRDVDVPVDEHNKLNKNPMHWCYKPLCPPGRLLGDLANRLEGTSINCPESKLLVAELYGDMSYPSIHDIILAWLVYIHLHNYKLHEMRMWKDDIRSAFNQFNFKPSETYKLAFSFAEGLIMIMMCGFFGWTGAPQVFANFSRGMLQVLRTTLIGCIFIFCDDFIGFGHHSQAQQDQSTAQHLIVQVFGPGAWAEEKCVPPCLQAEILGWWVDLTTATIRPSDKAIRKLTFTFFSINAEASHWPLQLCQVLASLSYRYSQGLMGMRPFVNPFYEMCAGPQNIQYRKVSAKARFAVEMWRVAIVLLFINKELMSVSLQVMTAYTVGILKLSLITDASYMGVGSVDLEDVGDSTFFYMGEAPFSSYHFPFHCKASKHQNHREFLGLIVGILMFIRLNKIPREGAVLLWVNDNTAALNWASENMCKGEASQIAFMLYSAIIIKFKLHVVETQHTAGTSPLMRPVDSLSRKTIPAIFNPALHISLNESPSLRRLMLLCDPSIQRNAGAYHESFVAVNKGLQEFCDEQYL